MPVNDVQAMAAFGGSYTVVPVDIEAVLSEATATHRSGDLDAAALVYDRIIAADPAHAEALHLRGVVHLQQGQNEAAAGLIGQSLAVTPDNPQALNNYGLALTALQRLDEAVAALQRATELNPASADNWANLGNALRRLKAYRSTEAAYRKALELAPERAGTLSALGVVLGELEQFEAALDSHQQAIRLAPRRADYRNNLAVTLRKAGREQDAEESLRLAIELSPTEGEYHAALGNILSKRGKVPEALASLRFARDHGSVMNGLDARLLFAGNYADTSAAQVAFDAEVAARRVSAGVKRYTDLANDRSADRPIRVGLVSADLRKHPVGRFLAAPLSHIDASQVVLFAYSGNDNDNSINLKLRSAIPNWRSVARLSDETLARTIHADAIDILVDLSGYTGGHRLGVFARKPAPVAVTYLGYFSTTGLDAIDYVLANRWLIAEDERSQWVETPWNLPHAHLCLYMDDGMPAVTTPPVTETGVFTFGSYNSMAKYSAGTLEVWGAILRAVPNSRLLMRNTADNLGPSTQIIEQMVAHGVAAERIQFEPVITDYYQHLDGYRRLDLALDPFPYNGGTTTVEALYMGVPVLTVHGDRYAAHMTESIVRAAGLDAWVAATPEDYVRLAVEAAAAPTALAALRAELRPRVLASSLFDGPAFARDLEDAFRGMWRAWCATTP